MFSENEFNKNDENNIENSSLLKPKSFFNPPRNRNSCLDKTIDFLKEQNFSQQHKNKSNISKEQWQGIQTLRQNKNLIIKEADKGGCVVLMNKTHYIKMINEHLNDNNTYKKTNEGCDQKVRKALISLTKKYEDILSKQESSYLTNFKFQTSNFYGLPKIHKSKTISEAIGEQNHEYIEIFEPADLTLRPIVGGPNCPTRPLSKLLDILLKPFITHVKSYIKDNLDFLRKCSRDNKETSVLVTFDVKSLYTSIPHAYGLEAINYWLDNFPENLHNRFNKSFILEGTKFVLENNNCTFDDAFYTQISGTAMGTIFAPTYATLTMGYLELKLYQVCEINFSANVRSFIFENWSRFLDDCEILLDSSLLTPEQLLEILNSLNQNIQFTMEKSTTEIPFLDIMIKRSDDGISLDLYRKPTDTQRCLNFNSCHPSHCKVNIPFSMARRICTIVENNELKKEHLNNLEENLKKYQYPTKVIEAGIARALSIPQIELRQPKEHNSQDVLAFVTTYNPNNPKVFSNIQNTVKTLKNNRVKGFENVKLIHGRRQAPNLKRLLTSSEFKSQDPEFGVFKCGDTRCKCCEHLLLEKKHIFKNVNREFILRSKITCSSSNLIYVVICPTCKEEYIGETGINATNLRKRVTIYRQHIKQPEYQMLKVEEHLRECGKGEFKIFPFYQLKTQDTALRRSLEEDFIKKFKTKLNRL